MEIQIAVSKNDKYLSTDSGDTVEVVERPNGGVSVVQASGFLNNLRSKTISFSVVKRVITHIADGVRDGAAARAASDALFTQFEGNATASLGIFSVDLQTDTIVLTCNSQSPVFIARTISIEKMATECCLLGTSMDIRPSISEIPLESGVTIIGPTSGLLLAGSDFGQILDFEISLSTILEDQEPTAQNIADSLISQAIRLDQNRPVKDMSVVVMRITDTTGNRLRKLTVNIPISDHT